MPDPASIMITAAMSSAQVVGIWRTRRTEHGKFNEYVTGRPFSGLDFWNDPDCWAGITDPHKQMFWMPR